MLLTVQDTMNESQEDQPHVDEEQDKYKHYPKKYRELARIRFLGVPRFTIKDKRLRIITDSAHRYIVPMYGTRGFMWNRKVNAKTKFSPRLWDSLEFVVW